MLRFLLRRTLAALAILVAISYASVLIQSTALRTRQNLPAPIMELTGEALRSTADIWRGLLRGDLGVYQSARFAYFSTGDVPLSQQLAWYMLNSMALLVLAMMVGGLVGGAIGVLAAATRRPGASLTLVLLSILGISTPSFLLGMLLQLLEIGVYKSTGLRLVPVGGYGWDNHLVLPLLVLGARPIAQVARLTFVRVSDTLGEDYVRTARSKGLAERTIWRVHVAPNAAAAVLTATGTSLRFSMSTLPVVEMLFGWPGAGRVLLEMLRTSQVQGSTVVILCFGAAILGLNMLLDLCYRILDPRLREATTQLRTETRWTDWLGALAAGLWDTITLRRRRERRRAQAHVPASLATLTQHNALRSRDLAAHERAMRLARRRAWMRAVSGNQALWLGAPLALALVVVMLAGPALAPHNPYSLSLSLYDVKPLQAPTAAYPLGTDAQGRDVLSLLLVGARRTLSIAFFAVMARLLVGGVLGFLSGWFSGSRLDRAIMGLGEVTAAFPSLLLAMLVIYAVGIRQGLAAFVVGLALVGWAEVMQTVRSQVLALRPMAFIEGAVASGATEGAIMSAHVLPNLWPTMVSLAFLEMGGVLMLLGELGFLGVFIGQGLQSQGGDFMPTVVYYDIPEWSVMLASSSGSYRSYPWATLYPALAFFLSVWAFTLVGEGLRRLTERLTLSFRSLFNRYTALAALALLFGVRWMFASTGFYATHATGATRFSTDRALADIQTLADPEYGGRLSGSTDADVAAEWIAAQFDALGMQPAGERLTLGEQLMGFGYYQHFAMSVRDLVDAPDLTLHGPAGQTITARYGVDYGRTPGDSDQGGTASGMVDVLAERFPWTTSSYMAATTLGIPVEEVDSQDRFTLRLNSAPTDWPRGLGSRGLWTLGEAEPPASSLTEGGDAASQFAHQLPSQNLQGDVESRLNLTISRELVERLLAAGGESLEGLEARIPQNADDAPLYYRTGWRATVDIPTERREAVPMMNVLAYWPGVDVNLDRETVVISAYYDGLGRLPDGALYPSANDNASGVATMLEMIRAMQQERFQPRRTLVFVAWCGGQRRQAPDYAKFMQAHTGFHTLEIVAALELEGVGGGSGDTAVAWRSTSQRLTEIVRQSAKRVGTPLDTRQAGLHANLKLWPWPDRDIPGLTLSWAGADALSALPEDAPDNIDVDKLGKVGRMATLAVMVLASDPAF